MSKKDEVQKREVLNSEIRLDGVGEQPAIKDLTSEEFLTADDMKAAEIARGVAHILLGELDEDFDRRFQKYQEWTDKRMKEAEKYNNDRMKWMEEQLEKVNKIQGVAPSERDRRKAKAAEIASEVQQEVVAEAANQELRFKQRVAQAPKVTITSYGKPYNTRNGIKYEPETIMYVAGTKTYSFKLPIGVPTELPDFVAAEYHKRRLAEQRGKALERELSVDNIQQFEKVAEKFPEIDPFRGANAQSGNELLESAKAHVKE